MAVQHSQEKPQKQLSTVEMLAAKAFIRTINPYGIRPGRKKNREKNNENEDEKEVKEVNARAGKELKTIVNWLRGLIIRPHLHTPSPFGYSPYRGRTITSRLLTK